MQLIQFYLIEEDDLLHKNSCVCRQEAPCLQVSPQQFLIANSK